jgi:hypothetical protein
MNGRLTIGSQTASGTPVVFASSIDTPVMPPSMKLLDNRNPLSPMAAEQIPRAMSATLCASRRYLLDMVGSVRARDAHTGDSPYAAHDNYVG